MPELADFLHLPVQSGSDRILALMKRGHTRLEYKQKIRRLREVRPDISISSDFIVGFPGETDRDFEDTMDFSADNAELFARLVASIVARRGLRHMDAGGVALLIEEGARLASDSEKLTLRIEPVADLVSEASSCTERTTGRSHTKSTANGLPHASTGIRSTR